MAQHLIDPPDNMYDGSEIKINIGMMITAIFMQFVLYSFGMTSPLREFPLAMELAKKDAPADDNAADANQAKRPVIDLPAKCFLLMGAFSFLVSSVLATWLDGFYHSKEVMAAMDWHERMVVQPGASFAAVGWTLACAMLTVYVIIHAVHEWLHNGSAITTKIIYVLAFLIPFGGLCAHAKTIPTVAKRYPHYKGTTAFLLLVVLWMMVQIALNFQERATCKNKFKLCLHLVAEAAGCVMLTLSALYHTVWSGPLLLILLACGALIDTRDVRIVLRNVRVADEVDFALLGKDHTYADTHHKSHGSVRALAGSWSADLCKTLLPFYEEVPNVDQ
jgi:hypothetical protein